MEQRPKRGRQILRILFLWTMEHNVILNIVIAPCRNTILYEMQ